MSIRFLLIKMFLITPIILKCVQSCHPNRKYLRMTNIFISGIWSVSEMFAILIKTFSEWKFHFWNWRRNNLSSEIWMNYCNFSSSLGCSRNKQRNMKRITFQEEAWFWVTNFLDRPTNTQAKTTVERSPHKIKKEKISRENWLQRSKNLLLCFKMES